MPNRRLRHNQCPRVTIDCNPHSLVSRLAGFIAGSAMLAGAAVAATNDAAVSSRSGAELVDMDLAQLIQIEIPTVVGASKHEQKVTEAPAHVTIITSDDVKKFGYRTLGDLLRSVPGLYITYDRSYGFIGVRGFSRPGDYGGRILLMVNGHRLNDPIYGSAPPATDFILDLDLIDRVEVIRGPGSSLDGDNAFCAVINVITRTGRQMNGPEASASAGSFDTYRGRATYGQIFSNGEEGVEIAKSRNGPRIDLVPTDVIMPQMGGKEMVQQIQPLLPKAKILFVSGYADDALTQHGVLEPGIAFLEKPFSPTRLTYKVREVLDA